MPGRFPLLTDENVPGPLIEALRSAGWDILHARELFGENTDDDVLIEHAARRERVLVRPRAFVDAFDELAARTDDPFRYPICYLKPKA